MAQKWTLQSLPWDRFDPEKVRPDLLAVVKAAALVEANSADYVVYLDNVFADDAAFRAAARIWGEEEAQHGAALARWAERADPAFSFAESLRAFQDGYRLPLDATESVRGSRVGELISRCVVETGTSSFYSAIRDASDEPVLKEIGRRIASDEFHHYRLFEKHLARYKTNGRLSVMERLKIAFGRVREAEDDELAYAWYAANVRTSDAPPPYDRKACAAAYWRTAMALYRRQHIDSAVRMILRAADIRPHGWLGDLVADMSWRLVSWRRERLRKAV